MFHHLTRLIPRASHREKEQGYLLIGLLFLAAILLIGLAIAAPQIGKQIQREKEVEAVHRGNQYKRAIQLYYRKMGRYPASIDQLKNTNDVRFLRQEYTDPITGKKDWKLLHYGEVPMETMGPFGQMTGAAGAPVAGATPATAMSGTTGGSAFGGSASGNSAFGGSGLSSGSNSSSSDIFNDSNSVNSNSADGSPGSSGNSASDQSSPNDGSSNSAFGSGANSGSAFGSPGSSGGAFGGGSNGLNGSNGSSSAFGSQLGAQNGAAGTVGTSSSSGMFGGSSVGGAPIIGVTIPSKKKSMISFRKKTEYDKWNFIYNPAEDISMNSGQSGAGSGAAPVTANGQSGFGSQQNGLGGQSGQSGSGNIFGGSGSNSGGFGGGMGSTSPTPSNNSGPQ